MSQKARQVWGVDPMVLASSVAQLEMADRKRGSTSQLAWGFAGVLDRSTQLLQLDVEPQAAHDGTGPRSSL
jgi:hypothetical protein